MSQETLAPTDQEILRNRFRGTLLGIAIGDALGAPLEFQPARQPNDYLTEMVGGGWLQLPPGVWTDDTQMTLATVDSLLAKRVFDPDDIAQRLVAWMKTNPPDIGIHTSHVLTAIANGAPWEQVTRKSYEEDSHNAPNGSLMRCAPLALFFYRHPDYIATLSPVISRITHAHPDCEWACICLNVAISWILMGESKQTAVEAAIETCEGASHALRERLKRALQPRCDTSPTGWVLDTLEVALWAFLHTNTFEASLINVVNRGADADTVGAVTGALAGAFYGQSGIPERWRAGLHDGERLIEDSDKLLLLAQSS